MHSATFIRSALISSEPALVHAKYAVACALIIFIVMSVTGNSMLRARRAIACVKAAVMLQTVVSIILLYFILTLGSPWPSANASSPIPLMQLPATNNRGDWLFSFWRPLSVLLTQSAAVSVTSSSVPKFICLIGCCWDIAQNLVSMVQIDSYLTQMNQHGAPLTRYNKENLQSLYWRDVISISISTLLLFQVLQLFIIQGCEVVAADYQRLSGNLQDRVGTVNRNRHQRLHGECDATLFSNAGRLTTTNRIRNNKK